MARHVVLLRGINLARNRRIAMADLREALTEAGFGDVRTLGQSGNVVLEGRGGASAVASAVEDVIAERFGFRSAVVVRTPSQLAAVVDRNPFADVADDPRRLLVHFLSGKPAAAAVRSLTSADVGAERVVASGRELYSWHPDGLQRSALAKLIGDAELGVEVTNRNWNTVTKLLALANQ